MQLNHFHQKTIGTIPPQTLPSTDIILIPLTRTITLTTGMFPLQPLQEPGKILEPIHVFLPVKSKIHNKTSKTKLRDLVRRIHQPFDNLMATSLVSALPKNRDRRKQTNNLVLIQFDLLQ